MLKDNEMLFIKRYPNGTRLESIRIVSKNPFASKIYENILDKNANTSAVEHYNDYLGINVFTIDHFFEGTDAVYHIHLNIPASLIDDESRLKWIDRIKSISNSYSSKIVLGFI